MDIDYKSLKLDALANLYRAAFALAQKDSCTGLEFLNQTNLVLTKKREKEVLSVLDPLLAEPEKNLSSPQNYLFWAEKILDCYHLLKNCVIEASATR